MGRRVGAPDPATPVVARGPASRAAPSPVLLEAVGEQYGIGSAHQGAEGGAAVRDLGGSSNLNLHVPAGAGDHPRPGQRGGGGYVVRVYRPWVTAARLAALQRVRRRLARGGVPCAVPVRTRDGASWIEVGGRLVEVEPYVAHDAEMDTWERLAAGLPLLGRIHALLRPLRLGGAGRRAPASNTIDAGEVAAGVRRGLARLEGWGPSPAERRLAAGAAELARLVDGAERAAPPLPRQPVHGDFWDNNVLFREGRIVLVGDLDFMGQRPRVDDLALTLYYTNSTFAEGRASGDRPRRLRALADAYDRGAGEPLTGAERAALPLALARAPLAFVAMLADVDGEAGARGLAAELPADVEWALDLVRDLDRWRSAFA